MNSQTKRSVMELPEQLKTFIANEDWIFAKTYATTWPHEYIVQERVDNDLFLNLQITLISLDTKIISTK